MTQRFESDFDPWSYLRAVTSARIALGRAGSSLPTRELLDFSLAHARARDAVHAPFKPDALAEAIARLNIPVRVVRSAAADRHVYLKRPELGRRVAPEDLPLLDELGEQAAADLVLIVSDGLSARAADRQVVPLLEELLPRLASDAWRIAPVIVVRHGRVAIQDEIGSRLRAELAVILLGERPGLGTPDSLGAYLVHDPRSGRTDADRNCVSNIRPEGLTPAAAAQTLYYLLTESRRRKLSGVALKDERPVPLPVRARPRPEIPGP